jgi:hypothetical protein
VSAWWAMPGPGDIPELGERCDYDGGIAEDDAILIADDCLNSIAVFNDRARAELVKRDLEQATKFLATALKECSKALEAIRRFS